MFRSETLFAQAQEETYPRAGGNSPVRGLSQECWVRHIFFKHAEGAYADREMTKPLMLGLCEVPWGPMSLGHSHLQGTGLRYALSCSMACPTAHPRPWKPR